MTTPLFPQPIPIIGITGEYQSGKSWLGISLCPDPKRLLVIDSEMGAEPYKSLGFTHVSVPQVMAAKYPKGYKPVDVFLWFHDYISNLEAGRYDVILVDPITDLERGLTDWVQANPQHFGHTAGQYATMSGIMWGDVKDYWKLILTGRVAAKCQTLAFVAHLGDEVKNKTFTGGRAPKGKDTLMEIASLYLHLERDKQKNRGVPSARVLKSRLSHVRMGEDGPEIRDALPPRLPVATPKALREYLLNPPDLANLKPEERVAAREMTAEERLRLEVARAEAERDAAVARAAVASPAPTPAAKPAPRPAAAAAPAPAAATPNNDSAGFRDNFAHGIRLAKDAESLKAVAADIASAKKSGHVTEAHAAELVPAYKAREKELAAHAAGKS